MTFQVILATDNKGGIGLNNSIPWNNRKDMKYFSQMTKYTPFDNMKNVIVMGRKTWESLPKKLPDRYHIIISSRYNENEKDVYWANSFDKAIEISKTLNVYTTWIIGGKSIYAQAFSHPECGNIYLTYIDNNYNCDTIINFKIFNYKFINEEIDNDVIKFYHTSLDHPEYEYLKVLNEIKLYGNVRNTRNGITKSLFGKTMEFDLSKGFPLLTTKRMFWRGIVEELLFFIRGDTNTKHLEEKKINIWNGNTNQEFLDKLGLDYQEGDMGPMYGFQWRYYNAKYKGCNQNYKGKGMDQLENIIKEIKNNPTSRRLVITDFNPLQTSESVLYPCHSLVLQFYVNENKLSVSMYQRSADYFLGVPFNIASTSLLLMIICQLTDLNPGKVIINLGDCHIYENHLDLIDRQLSRIPYQLPKLTVPKFKTLEDVENSGFKDYDLEDYQYHPGIKAEMVV